MKTWLTVCLFFSLSIFANAAEYKTQQIQGWTVHVSEKLLADHAAETEKAIKILTDQLQLVERAVPGEPLKHLKTVPLWMSPKYEKFGPTAEYHPDAGWLKSHGRDPKMAKCVEFTNVLIFEAELKRMPVFVLHELAHAYHDQVLGFDSAEVEAVYKRAMEQKLYDLVERNDGKKVKHYACTNAKEYFAESSESYFGRNDFFPYDQAELEKHDPDMLRLLKRVWKVE